MSKELKVEEFCMKKSDFQFFRRICKIYIFYISN